MGRFIVGVFEENARLLQWLVFFVSSTRSIHFLVQLFNIINLNYAPPKHTRNAITSFKTKKSTYRTSKTYDAPRPLVFFTPIFFGTMRLFWIPPKALPFVCFDILQHNESQKIPKGPPFTFFGTVTLFKNLIIKKNSRSPKGPPLIFFKYFATNWSFTKPKGSPLLQF